MSSGFLPLVLSVKAANWRMNDEDAAAADAEFRQVRTKALQRDNQTCRFCGFRAPKWQEVHHLNDDHGDNRLPNLVTACMFCHLCQHIGLAGRNKEATLVWLPEIPQDRLNHIVRSVLVAQRWADTFAADKRNKQGMVRAAKMIAESARAIESRLRAREADAERIFGTANPQILGDALLQLANASHGLYERRGSVLKGLRLMPLGKRVQSGGDQMPQIIDHWLGPGGPYASLRPNSWHNLLREAA